MPRDLYLPNRHNTGNCPTMGMLPSLEGLALGKEGGGASRIFALLAGSSVNLAHPQSLRAHTGGCAFTGAILHPSVTADPSLF